MAEEAVSPTINDLSYLTSKDLLGLKRQVLKQAYDREIKVKEQKITLANPERENSTMSESRLYPSRSVHILPTYSPKDREAEKQILKESYQADMHQKEIRKQQERNKIRQQTDILSQLNKYQSQYQQKQRKVKEQYAKFLQEEIIRKEQLKRNQRRQQHEQQHVRSNRKKGLLNKQHSFKQFFSSVDKYRNNVSAQYLNYLKEAKVKEQERVFNDRQLVEKQRKMIEEQANQEKRRNLERKQELRKVLEQQIMENRSYKANELQEFKNRGYVHNSSNLYNPISNPIDYQMDLNNKYLMRQLMEKQVLSQPYERANN